MITMYDRIDNKVPHILYDLSLPLEERKDKAVVFPSARHVADFLGVTSSRIMQTRMPGKKVQGRDGKIYAVRIAPVSK